MTVTLHHPPRMDRSPLSPQRERAYKPRGATPLYGGRGRGGYIFLVSVLVIGAIASATAASLLLLGWAAEQNGYLLMQSAQTYEYAETCAERAILRLRTDPSYVGNVTQSFERGSCVIGTVGGSGTEERSVCITAYSGDSVRRMEIGIDRLYPSVVIRVWREVSSFTLCP